MATEADNQEPDTHDPHYEPIVSLPEQTLPPLEEDEDILFKMRAKLFRWAKEVDPPEWKERGTGDVKLLKHKKTSRIRLLMRRDKTFKTCANHYVEKHMELVPNCNSDRAWVWTTFADFAEEEPREELLAIKFLNAENANKFKEKFDECREMNSEIIKNETNGEGTSTKTVEKEENEKADDMTQKLLELAVSEKDEEVKNEEAIKPKNEEKTRSVEDSPEK